MKISFIKKNKINFFFKKKTIIFLTILIIFSFTFYSLKIYKKNKEKNDIEKFESIILQLNNYPKKSFYNGEKFAQEKKNIYSVLMNIELSKKLIKDNNIKKAEEKLQNTLKTKIPNEIKDIIYIRLARISLHLNKIKNTFYLLKKIKNKNWYPIIQNIKGDTFLKIGKIKQAESEYKKGIRHNNSEILNSIIQYKINNLQN